MIDFFTFPMGAAIGLFIGFLLSYVLHLKNLQDALKHRREHNKILRNVKSYLEKQEDNKKKDKDVVEDVSS